MSDIVEVPDDFPSRSPDVECPFGEEGSSEKTMESRKRNAESVDGDEEKKSGESDIDIPAKKAKLDEPVEPNNEGEETDSDIEVLEVIREQEDSGNEEGNDRKELSENGKEDDD
uniref:Uncharacterized protein n=1 Tax=Caenorhabditis japonica TaxID=281687 RepID=A0A8R1HVJ2_CAEJA